MDTIPEPLTAWRRRYFVRIVIGTVLVVVVYSAISIYATYQREQRTARKIKSLGGRVGLRYRGPKWIPTSFQARLPFFERIEDVYLLNDVSSPLEMISTFNTLTNVKLIFLNGKKITDAGIEQLNISTSIETLNLGGTSVSDNGLKHLNRAINLRNLHLNGTQVTDLGLQHLQGMSNLQSLGLGYTAITDAGLQHLKCFAKLEYLVLNYTQVTDVGLDHLKGLTSLRVLSLHDTETTEEGRAIIQKALPSCIVTPYP